MSAALIAGVLAAVAYGSGSVLQAAATRRSSGLRVLAQPLYLLGLGLDLVGWLLSLLALRSLPLFAVESLLSGSLAVTVVLARVVLGVRLRRVDVAAVVLVVAALAVLAVAAGEQPAGSPPGGFTRALLVIAVVLVLVTVVAYRSWGATVLAVIAGLGYAGAALAARGAHGIGAGGGGAAGSDANGAGALWQVVTQPLALVIVLCGGVAALAYVRAVEHGAVGPVTALVAVVEVVVPGVVGVAALGDGVRAGWAPVSVLAVCVALVGCVVLANSPGQRAAA